MSLEDKIKKVTPYVPGEQPPGEVVKLNTNENPYPPSPLVQKALEDAAADFSLLRKYPDPDADFLKNALAESYGVSTENIFVGVGSDDVLAMSFMTFFNSDLPVLFPDITYSFYKVWCNLFGIPYKAVPVRDDFTIDISGYNEVNGGIVIANPNAPTSIALDEKSLISVIEKNPDSVVIVDEAYIDFGGSSMLPYINKYDNLLVVQTFSKSRSMAGARIGMAFASPGLISYLNDVKFSFNSYTMSRDAQLIGKAALSDREYYNKTIKLIKDTRTEAEKKLNALGFEFNNSSANFIFASHKTAKASYIFEELKKRNIYVRYFPQDRIDNHLRITIGTPKEMETLYQALSEIL